MNLVVEDLDREVPKGPGPRKIQKPTKGGEKRLKTFGVSKNPEDFFQGTR
jgi:hypothetical protein